VDSAELFAYKARKTGAEREGARAASRRTLMAAKKKGLKKGKGLGGVKTLAAKK